MRLARPPQNLCGRPRLPALRDLSRARGRVLRCSIIALLTACVGASSAVAQVTNVPKSSPKASSFKQGGGSLLPKAELDKSQPLYLQGDELIYDTDGNRVVARGNVEIYYNNFILTANEVIYDQGAGTLTAVGNVVLKEPSGNVVRADRYTLTEDFRDGFVQSLSVVAKDDTKISADRATRRDGNVTEFSNAKFTPCKTVDGSPPLWCIRSQRIIHDQQAATIVYQDAQFEVFGVPVFYLPYFQHADPSVKRKSGFLPPSFGSSGDLGFTAEVPYYFALSPNFDFVFHPQYTTKQGVLWQGHWRHRLANGQYSVKFAGIDQDISDLPGNGQNRSELDGWRGSLETKGKFSLGDWWSAGWDVTLESDDSFRRFYKLDSILLTDRVNNIYLTGLSDRNYFAANLYHFGGLLLDDTGQSESLVHPVIDYNYVVADPILGGEVKWNTNVLSLSRDDNAEFNASSQDVSRVVTEVSWRRRLIDPLGITYTPYASLRGDLYQYSNYVDPTTAQVVSDDSVARGQATAGATISYPWAATTARATHVIEPIGQIVVHHESVTQRRLPNEDARSLVFDDTNLFETTKFSGWDRLETGTRANAGLQYTFQMHDGGSARVLAGQSFHLGGDNAYENPGTINQFGTAETEFVFSPNSGLETDRSDYVLGAYVSPFQDEAFRLIAQSRFNEDDFELRRSDISAEATYGPFSGNVNYSYIANDAELALSGQSQQEIRGGASLRLTEHWSVGGKIRYDLDEEFLLADTVQLRYGDECFVLTASYTETFIDDPERDISPDRTVMLRFEFKHLGSYEYKTDALDFVFGDQQPPT